MKKKKNTDDEEARRRKEIRDCRTYLPGYLSRFIISYCRWSHALLADEEGRGEFLKPCPIEFAYIARGMRVWRPITGPINRGSVLFFLITCRDIKF